MPAVGTLVSVFKTAWKVAGQSCRKSHRANMWWAPIWEMENQDFPPHRTGKVPRLMPASSIGHDLRRSPLDVNPTTTPRASYADGLAVLGNDPSEEELLDAWFKSEGDTVRVLSSTGVGRAPAPGRGLGPTPAPRGLPGRASGMPAGLTPQISEF